MATFQELKGSDIVGLVQDRLGGYANALDNSVVLDVINEGKDEIWAIIKNLSENYFQVSTQFSDASKDGFFGPLSNTQREYVLPKDFRAYRYIECVTPGFQQVEFVLRKMTTPTFKDARRAANEQTTSSAVGGVQVYFFDIVETRPGGALEDGGTGSGGFEIVMAQFPESALQLVIFYLRCIPDMEMDTVLDQILFPFSKKIANFAVEKCMKILQDSEMSEMWVKSWRQDIITIAQSAGSVNQGDPSYVIDFIG